ncbi:MAG: hypothetical protein DM484_21540 [Candidatus Methylumidiphilus alinenensis]|uniref:Bacterial repeat domain-containing protein n=1 Tax=Candidatus Methylumidiphilus alinenensis TaxID=2202197 RepID=A0A2W4QQ67_9GAMM|nr:MAG: hypothetical protein DM484_21540 [Candidatus Methylumidiphilus alinenensis]
MKVSNPIVYRYVSSVFQGFILIGIIGIGDVAKAAVNLNAAYNVLTQRTSAVQNAFYVYQDADSAYNHGFPSGWMGDYPTIHLNAACVNAALSPNGCSSDTNALDIQRDTVVYIRFGNQISWSGVSFVEPQNLFSTTFVSKGYDLTGATYLVFDVRSPTPNGFRVLFGFAGHTMTYFITIPQSTTFTTLTIPLAAFNVTLADLASVNVLFTVETDNLDAPNGGILLLDNIHFEPVPTKQQSVLGLPLSTQTFGVVTPQTSVPIDQANKNIASLYESALTLLALLAQDSPTDLVNAKLIADSMDYALSHDNHGDYLPPFPSSPMGLHNAYESGDIALFSGQGVGAGQQGDIRVAGFSSTTCAPSNYCVILDGATGGNNAFAILSLISAYNRFQDTRYLNDAATIGQWIVNQLLDTSNTGYGGYYLGYPDEGAPPPKPLEKGKSIENNADIFAAFSTLAFTEQQLGNTAQANYWTAQANVAGDFVMQMYDSTRGCFFAGTVPPNTTGAGIQPNGPTKGNDTINTYDFLDSNSFTTLAMAGSPRYAKAIDWHKPVQCIVNKFAQTVTAANITYSGFNIVSGVNGVAWEFTGQVTELMNYVNQLYKDSSFASQAATYLAQIAQAQATAPFGDGSGLVASTLQNGDTLAPAAQCLQTPYQCIPERVGLAATAWAIFAAQNYNPLNSPFNQVPNPNTLLTVINNNPTNGMITSNYGGINCGTACAQYYDSGSYVVLTANPVSGYEFSGWRGACSGYGNSCTVTMNAAQTVTANFAVFKIHQPTWKRVIKSIIKK